MNTKTSGFSVDTIDDSVLVIKTGTTLDNNNAHEIFEFISKAHSEKRYNIIVDMGELEFLSSAGVGSIIGTVDVSRESGGEIVLCNVSEQILHILNILDLADYLTIRRDRDHSIEVFQTEND